MNSNTNQEENAEDDEVKLPTLMKNYSKRTSHNV